LLWLLTSRSKWSDAIRNIDVEMVLMVYKKIAVSVRSCRPLLAPRLAPQMSVAILTYRRSGDWGERHVDIECFRKRTRPSAALTGVMGIGRRGHVSRQETRQ
jgi:hypothetical protein